MSSAGAWARVPRCWAQSPSTDLCSCRKPNSSYQAAVAGAALQHDVQPQWVTTPSSSFPFSDPYMPRISTSGEAASQTSTIHYQNPLLYGNFPDPGIMKVGTRFYAFATNGGGGNVQAAASRDLVRGTPLRRS